MATARWQVYTPGTVRFDPACPWAGFPPVRFVSSKNTSCRFDKPPSQGSFAFFLFSSSSPTLTSTVRDVLKCVRLHSCSSYIKKKNTCRSGTSQPASIKSAVDFLFFSPSSLPSGSKAKWFGYFWLQFGHLLPDFMLLTQHRAHPAVILQFAQQGSIYFLWLTPAPSFQCFPTHSHKRKVVFTIENTSLISGPQKSETYS